MPTRFFQWAVLFMNIFVPRGHTVDLRSQTHQSIEHPADDNGIGCFRFSNDIREFSVTMYACVM